MMTVFPAVLVLVDRRHASRPRRRAPARPRARAHPRAVRRAAGRLPQDGRWPWPLVADRRLAAGVCAACEFDYNLLNLQACRHRVRRLGEEDPGDRRPLRASRPSPARTRSTSCGASRRRSSALPSVSEVDSALLLIPDDQPEKRKIIADFAPLVAPVRVGRPTAAGPRPAASTSLETLQRRFDIAGQRGARRARPSASSGSSRTTSDGSSPSCARPTRT